MPDIVEAHFAADIVRTEYGVAHVRADDLAGIGFGQGWACATDNLPTIADHLLKTRSERALVYGAGPLDAHVASDFGYRALDVMGRGHTLEAAQSDDVQALVRGYVAGYNRAVRDAHEQETLPPWCAGATWVREVTVAEFYAHLVDILLMGSGRNLAQLIGRAEAPGPDGPRPPSPMEALAPPAAASNGWAVGGDVTASGHGMVLANPHFPWWGEARFWECHLTIPGDLDVYGACLLGIPGVQMGFNHDVAWTHTFSIGARFTAFRLDLVPGSPTEYRYGDDTRAMTSATHHIQARTADGVETVERTLWSSHHGPMLNLPLIGWGNELGFTYRDANIENSMMLQQYVRMDRARSLAEFKAAFAEEQGTAWVNTMAADAHGDIWYCDGSATPRIGAAAQERLRVRLRDDFVAALLAQNRVIMLDGSDPDDDWLDAAAAGLVARSPGVEPFSELPQLARRDYVVNANDSYWLANADEPITGHSVLCGFTDVGQSLRTRQNLRLAAALARRGGVQRGVLLAVVFDHASLSAELLLDAVADRCAAAGTVTVEGHECDLARAAGVLRSWDRRVDTESVGAIVWREFVNGFTDDALRGVPGAGLFSTAFDASDPVGTHRDLVGASADSDPIVQAMGHAVRLLAQAGIPIDARLGAHQWVVRGAERIAVPGGGEVDGVLDVLSPYGAMPNHALEPTPAKAVALPGRERSGLAAGGYPCDYGTSFLFAVEMTPDGPVAEGLLTYGQCIDPASPHHADQTRLYAAKQPRPMWFHAADVDAHATSRVRIEA